MEEKNVQPESIEQQASKLGALRRHRTANVYQGPGKEFLIEEARKIVYQGPGIELLKEEVQKIGFQDPGRAL